MRASSFTVIVAFLSLALAGLSFIPLLPVKLSPSYTLPSLTVRFDMPNNSARVIEMEVTSRLEAMLARISGVREIRSTSGNGYGTVTLELDRHTDVDVARFEASTIIRQTWPGLPEGVSYPVLEMNRPDDTDSRPFMSYTLNAASTPVFIQRFAENRIRPRLAGIPGVYRIDVSGATPMEWRLEYDSRQLAALGIQVGSIQEAISHYLNREFLGTGRIRESGSEWIRLALIPDAQGEGFDPATVSVTDRNGKMIRLDQLLTVVRREEAPRSYYRINGLNSIYISIRADETANQLQLAGLVKAEMESIRSALPAGYEVHTSYDATEYIRAELRKIYIRTGLTVLILLLFVLLITRNLRYMFLIVTSLTVNLCIAVIFYYLLRLEMQLYSLAGVTISLSLVIDNTIVMADHIKNRRDRSAFLPILTATVTTIGALSVIFFLDERIRLNLQDFAAVVIINLAVSLFVALFFVPAMIERMGMFRRRQAAWRVRRVQRIAVYLSRFYMHLIRIFCRWRVWACVALALLFGLPVFMLPEKIEMKGGRTYSHLDSVMIHRYNEVAGNEMYREKIKPALDRALGGSLRLFVQKVYSGSYFTNREETVLTVTASMPNGTTLSQMNSLVGRMEAYLTTNGGIRQFQTSIFSARQARIEIFFTKESERSGFPYTLKSRIVSRALELGGGSWGVYGLPADQGFSNDVRESAGNYRIELHGYNYDELYTHAERLRATLLENRRIREVVINSEFSWYKDDYQEYYFNLDRTRMAEAGVLPGELFASLYPVFGKDISTGSIVIDGEAERLKLTSRQSDEYDIWSMQHMPLHAAGGASSGKLSELATVEKGQMPQRVAKIDQQYRLCMQYEYIGASTQGARIQERTLEEFNATLPTGYGARAESYYWAWRQGDGRQYLLLLLIIVIIFFTSGILFNSLRQPLAIIFVIPVSYIGVFLTFYWFRLNFDQGGFASFVLLCGVTVNASIYVLNEYNRIRERKPLMPPRRAYMKAWNAKITPIFLTIVSTVLGFIPFMIGDGHEAFWFPLAAGTIGGLLMSFIGIYLYLPVFTLKKD
ncbi:MAG: efflux RND transporter permease subunit [Tannerella sp.]|jgi:multidrug efflux pump subunit AcrB|nr:efflux RND transporter permease subunit [Tannerella sp.]